MDAAAAVLTGRHDFASFQNVGTPVADTIRTVWNIYDASRALRAPCDVRKSGPVVTWFFHGEGFFKQMVRNLMGLMVYAGLGRADSEDIRRYLDAKDRRAFPSVTAPAKGLTLYRVEYPADIL
jgi:tRNA pseudouridine38-40 synthase